MKNLVISIFVFVSLVSCNTEDPITFSAEALGDNFISYDGESITVGEILEEHQGTKIVFDVWASWCRDCIEGLPELRELQAEFPEVEFVFLSQDRSIKSWKSGIKRYNLQGKHYFMPNGWDGPFVDFIDLDWIPRYMVVDEAGDIALFDAVKASDKRIRLALE